MDVFQNFRHAQNLIKNDINQVLVEDIMVNLLLLFRECLKNELVPIVIDDINRNEYLDGLKEYMKKDKTDKLMKLFEKEQQF